MTPEEFFGALQNMPQPKPVIWRLYYDATGRPIEYSMEDQPGRYIDIDPTTYARGNMNVRVRHGKLVEISVQTTRKLVPGHTIDAPELTSYCHPQNVAVVVTEDQPHQKWRRKIYESS